MSTANAYNVHHPKHSLIIQLINAPAAPKIQSISQIKLDALLNQNTQQIILLLLMGSQFQKEKHQMIYWLNRKNKEKRRIQRPALYPHHFLMDNPVLIVRVKEPILMQVPLSVKNVHQTLHTRNHFIDASKYFTTQIQGIQTGHQQTLQK